MIIYEMRFFKCIKRLSFFKQSIRSEDIVSCVFPMQVTGMAGKLRWMVFGFLLQLQIFV